MGEVKAWPNVAGIAAEPPRLLKRPCDYGLELAWGNLEAQLGTIEGYNRLVAFAMKVRAKIDAGGAIPQNALFAVSTGERKGVRRIRAIISARDEPVSEPK